MRERTLFRNGAAALLAFCANAAPAQTYVSPWQDVVNGQIASMHTLGGLETLRQSADLADAAGRRAAGKAAADSPAAARAHTALAFRPSAAVSRRVHAQLLESFAAAPPEAAAALRQALDSGELARAFDDLLRQFGYSSRNLADVMTAYLVLGWEIVNGADASKQTAGIAAVRARLLENLARDPQVRRLGDAAKQEAAETMSLGIMFAVAANREFRAQGRDAPLQQLRSGLRSSIRDSFGIDLQRLALTDDGFETRS